LGTVGRGGFENAMASFIVLLHLKCDLPTDLPDQKDTYARICAKLVYKYEIVENVVINLDETGVQYCIRDNFGCR
jgi:hypothetical protein